ncbi:biopolymer transporter ExbB [Desulfobacter hydrogenophilus]|uniref:Biopolymer transporter ExbB n=1 Tax=Desulfobacter hydrogenophilus TaxID=2291 RepID=A0A328F5Y5_9BACT|nr:MotA/TolQ/ExbB proton channel family protein [Desulfobacter hydrogenophilus]NDY74496.1 MotA/TolQ/ExbB proton channel family protein [Desulfobacter hydrogenophilus]QBH15168.1 MotA/TolQ/ExbB proton channel family protein [Desulfobacter hydrogenophilus]RAL99943.1 biopolymer transporter ExbB [Desulfobacter hydrogenophilus]
MKKRIIISILAWVCIGLIAGSGHARDMRQAAVEAKKQLHQAKQNLKSVTADIQKDKATLTREIKSLSDRVAILNTSIKEKTDRITYFTLENQKLAEKAAQGQAELDELSGAVRVAAGNLKSLLTASVYTARDNGRLDKLTPMLDTNRFPGLDDMGAIADLFMEEMTLTAGIDLETMAFVSDTGEQVKGEVLTLGGFTSAYRAGKKTGFLNYSPETGRLYALSALPKRSIQKSLSTYMNGNSDSVYIDISRGGALRQITHRQTLKDQIEKGGMLVWPILALGVFAVFIGIERSLFLSRVHSNTDKVMGKVNQLAAQGAWEECDQMVEAKKIPVHNVLKSGLNARQECRETVESVLQESILKELPRLERFLPMLNIMGAIAPLLGLLGTVTGMISTFHVITLYGTGDPRMMSGGISTALVTTMLGLGVAIPIMLLYTFLTRQVDHVIGDMEEKAVTLTNIIFREACTCECAE